LRLEPNWETLLKISNVPVYKLVIENIVNNKEISKDSSDQLLVELMEIAQKAHEENIEKYLKDTFRIDSLSEIIHDNKNEAIIKICNDIGSKWIQIVINKDNAKMTGFREMLSGENFVIKYLKEQRKIALYKDNKESTYEHIPIKEQLVDADVYKLLLVTLAKTTVNILVATLSFTFGAGPYILTDSKSGILRLAPSLIRNVLSPERAKEFPLNLPDREMLSNLVIEKKEIRSKKISEIADFIEEEIKGVVDIKTSGLLYPEIYFKKGEYAYPIIRSSSGARELAPLILYLRYVLKEERLSIVAIEEPETHLHPYMQSVATRALALLGKYTSILITTHSPVILDELNNLIKLNKLTQEDKREAGYKETEGIEHESVRVYRFKIDGSVEVVKISEDGIYEDEFSSVVIELSNKYAEVEELLRKPVHEEA
jgi:hypothetical protein